MPARSLPEGARSATAAGGGAEIVAHDVANASTTRIAANRSMAISRVVILDRRRPVNRCSGILRQTGGHARGRPHGPALEVAMTAVMPASAARLVASFARMAQAA